MFQLPLCNVIMAKELILFLPIVKNVSFYVTIYFDNGFLELSSASPESIMLWRIIETINVSFFGQEKLQGQCEIEISEYNTITRNRPLIEKTYRVSLMLVLEVNKFDFSKMKWFMKCKLDVSRKFIFPLETFSDDKTIRQI